MRVRVHYPLEHGTIVLRTEDDWEKNVEPVAAGGSVFEFRLELTRPYLYFKPVLLDGTGPQWSTGENLLLLASGRPLREVYPHFVGDAGCSACTLRELDGHHFRVFYPPGYAENTLKRYPVLYMQDGQNLFFPGEAFGGNHWKVPETLAILDRMNAIEEILVVGIYPRERTVEYTQPGWESYGRFLVDTLKPAIDAEYRTLPQPERTGVMGSSLGGVVSLYLHWQFPQVFGKAACLSSTFGWRDDLRARVLEEPRRPGMLYLDSGWPADNYEVTRDLRGLLVERGYHEGQDLLYFAFPEARHSELAWAMRCHIPLQFFFSHGGRELVGEKSASTLDPAGFRDLSLD
ncbi:MAG TPA: alpha/beta hydrolase-fold protein [Candidatus Polarisedimenticolaceae bacterium]|nr:alpha/beta hydrolase-fold protein [Candidatus Polarisedimenticolaceae bacterium]